MLSTTGSKAKITLRGQLLSAASGVDQVMLADGTEWTSATLLAPATGARTF